MVPTTYQKIILRSELKIKIVENGLIQILIKSNAFQKDVTPPKFTNKERLVMIKGAGLRANVGASGNCISFRDALDFIL